MFNQKTIYAAAISAPAKIILCGEHAVVYGQDALAMAIDLRCNAKIARGMNEQKLVTIKLKLSQHKIYSVRSQTLQQLPQYPQYLLKRQNQNEQDEEKVKFEYKYQLFKIHTKVDLNLLNNFLIEIDSQIPIGKCLGSSAAFNTVLAASFLYIHTGSYILDLQEVNTISHMFERVEHGTPSGIDNFVSTYGGLVLYNNQKQPKFKKIQEKNILINLTKSINLQLIDSSIEKNTKKAVDIVRKNKNSNQKYSDIITQIGTFAHQIIQLLSNKQGGDNKWKIKLIDIIIENHKHLKQLGVSIPQIEEIVQKYTIVNEQGVKITGAGMGGYVLSINIHPHQESSNKNQINNNTKILQINFDPKGLIIDNITE